MQGRVTFFCHFSWALGKGHLHLPPSGDDKWWISKHFGFLWHAGPISEESKISPHFYPKIILQLSPNASSKQIQNKCVFQLCVDASVSLTPLHYPYPKNFHTQVQQDEACFNQNKIQAISTLPAYIAWSKRFGSWGHYLLEKLSSIKSGLFLVGYVQDSLTSHQRWMRENELHYNYFTY